MDSNEQRSSLFPDVLHEALLQENAVLVKLIIKISASETYPRLSLSTSTLGDLSDGILDPMSRSGEFIGNSVAARELIRYLISRKDFLPLHKVSLTKWAYSVGNTQLIEGLIQLSELDTRKLAHFLQISVLGKQKEWITSNAHPILFSDEDLLKSLELAVVTDQVEVAKVLSERLGVVNPQDLKNLHFVADALFGETSAMATWLSSRIPTVDTVHVPSPQEIINSQLPTVIWSWAPPGSADKLLVALGLLDLPERVLNRQSLFLNEDARRALLKRLHTSYDKWDVQLVEATRAGHLEAVKDIMALKYLPNLPLDDTFYAEHSFKSKACLDFILSQDIVSEDELVRAFTNARGSTLLKVSEYVHGLS